MDPHPGGYPTPDQLDEVTIVARAQDGDLVAFEHLVDRYQVALFRFAFRMLYDRGEAEDVVQDTLVQAWRRLPTLAKPEAFRSWLYQVAHRRCLNVLRERASRRTDLTRTGNPLDRDNGGSQGEYDDTSGPAQFAETAVQLRDLGTLLDLLPTEQRACWVMNGLNDLSYPEIATILGVPVSTVRGRIARARQRLAEGMQQWR